MPAQFILKQGSDVLGESAMHTTAIVYITFSALLLLVIIIISIIGYVKVSRKRVTTGAEAFKDSIATVLTPLKPTGTVLFDGEIWKATIDHGAAQKGEEVAITGAKGLKLLVTKIHNNNDKGGC